MVKTFMLLLALTVTDPDGIERDEKFHVLSRHFDTKELCLEFIDNWQSVILSRGKRAVNEMLDEGWGVEVSQIVCTTLPEVHEPLLKESSDT